MPESKPLVWFWRNPDNRWKNEVLNYINSVESSHKGTVILHCRDIKGFDESYPLSNYLFNVGLMHNLFEDERSIFLNSKDLITAIELCLQQEKKQNESSDIGIADEDIIQCYKAYQDHFVTENGDPTNKTILHLKKFMKENNCIDLCLLYAIFYKCQNMQPVIDFLADYKFLILGAPESHILKKAIYFINGNEEQLQSISVKIPKDLQENVCSNSSLPNITSESLKLEDISLLNEKQSELGSATEEYVEDVIIAFLSLLVNSRNELALCKAMISPVVNLSHEAFTELKHLAAEKDMPMCQVAISYVTRIKLGGKGYAPPPDCPMLPHIKGLELFVEILNQIQTLIEEESVSGSAIKKLINILKRKLLKSSGNLKADAIETGAQNLISTFLTSSSFLKMKKENNTTPQICQETLDTLYSFINFVNCNYWILDPEKILAKKQIKRTPLNLPPLLGYFRTPEDESCDTLLTMNDNSNASKASVVPPHTSYFHNSDSSSASISCVDHITPSKMTFKGCLNSEDIKFKVFEQSKSAGKAAKNPGKEGKNPFFIPKNRKRSILSEITNENIDNENNYKTSEKKQKHSLIESKKKNKDLKKNSKIPKKIKLIPGQGKITTFFTSGKN